MEQLKDALERANIKDIVEKEYKERKKLKNRLKYFYTELKKRFLKIAGLISVKYKEFKTITIDWRSFFKLGLEENQKTRDLNKAWYPTLSELRENVTLMTTSRVVTVWDIENISAKYVREVFEVLQTVSREFYIIKCKPLSKRETQILFPYILYHKIKVIT